MENIKIDFKSEFLKFGIGLFETIKITKKPIYLNYHLDRLYNSLKELEINFTTEKKVLKNEILNYINQNKIKNKSFRVTVFDDGYFFDVREISYTDEIYKKGFKLTFSKNIKGNSFINKHKTTNYFENIYSKKIANKNNFDDAIFLNQKEEILETTICNIYFVKNNIIYTPNQKLNFLNGIIRQRIIKLCYLNNIKIVETIIKKQEIKNFDFCFLSNSLVDVIKVSEIDNICFKTENQIFNKIQKLLRNDYEKQDL